MNDWTQVLPPVEKHHMFGDTFSDITQIAAAVAGVIVLILQIIARQKQFDIHTDVKELKQAVAPDGPKVIVPKS